MADGSAKISNTREETANTLLHGVGFALAIAGLCVLVIRAAGNNGSAWKVVSTSIFGAMAIIMYASSSVYHYLGDGRAKRVFQIIDHSAIYLMIAGTYTPYTLVPLRGPLGWTYFGVVWGLALTGIALKTSMINKFPVIGPLIYVVMGWISVFTIPSLLKTIGDGGMALLAAGGAFYTLGLIFFAWERLPYNHAIWHVFVLVGSVCHFFSILYYVVG